MAGSILQASELLPEQLAQLVRVLSKLLLNQDLQCSLGHSGCHRVASVGAAMLAPPYRQHHLCALYMPSSLGSWVPRIC